MFRFEDYLSRTLSRKEIDVLVEAVAVDPLRLQELLDLVGGESPQIAWHAAWGVEKLFRKYPELFTEQMLENIMRIAVETSKEGIRRLMLSILKEAELPEILPVELINKAFEWLRSENSAIAVKALCMYYLLRICQREPDLLSELQLYVSQLLESADSPAIRSVGRKVMRAGRTNCK